MVVAEEAGNFLSVALMVVAEEVSVSKPHINVEFCLYMVQTSRPTQLAQLLPPPAPFRLLHHIEQV